MGASIAGRLAAEGAKVVLSRHQRGKGRGGRTERINAAAKDSAMSMKTDVTAKRTVVAEMVEMAIERYGTVGILVIRFQCGDFLSNPESLTNIR